MQAAVAVPRPASSSVERRRVDRRRRPTPMLSRYTIFGGRRAGDRRVQATTNAYVDRYPASLAVSLAAIGLLCALDAVFTLLYVQKGGGEANPFMEAVMHSSSPTAFVIFKCVVTNLGLMVLCLHQNFRFVRPVIATLLTIYTALFAYHIYLAATVA